MDLAVQASAIGLTQDLHRLEHPLDWQRALSGTPTTIDCQELGTDLTGNTNQPKNKDRRSMDVADRQVRLMRRDG